jgi:hypothetical protein
MVFSPNPSKRGNVKSKHQSKGGEIPNLLHHIDLTTGNHAIHRIDTLSPRWVKQCGKLLPNGGRVPNVKAPCHVTIAGPLFNLYYRDSLILTGGVGRGRDSTWRRLIKTMRMYNYSLEAAPRPGLWLAEVPLPSLYMVKDGEVSWVFDFLRHLAAAMVTSEFNDPI